jgi:hypothetical protein
MGRNAELFASTPYSRGGGDETEPELDHVDNATDHPRNGQVIAPSDIQYIAQHIIRKNVTAFPMNLLTSSLGSTNFLFGTNITGPFIVTFHQFDAGISFLPFLERDDFSPEILTSRAALEHNRCFFLHIGLLLSLHPSLIQAAFRKFAKALLVLSVPDEAHILGDVLQETGFIDAHVLIQIFPFDSDVRLNFIAGPPLSPIVHSFSLDNNSPKTDYFLRMGHHSDHFTALTLSEPQLDLFERIKAGLPATSFHEHTFQQCPLPNAPNCSQPVSACLGDIRLPW